MISPMVVTPLALLLVARQRAADQYTLGYYQESFVVRFKDRKEVVPLTVPVSAKKLAVSFRRDKKWAVWDDRGLTTRAGDWVYSDRLETVAVSPRAQPRENIRESLQKIAAGKRTKAASALSGAKRVGNIVYFLVRWDDSDGKPWLETLMAVDFSEAKPKPKLLGAFKGLSLAKGPIDDRLYLAEGVPAAIIRTDDAWGEARYEPKSSRFAFSELGTKLFALENDGRIIEGTPYGTTVVGQRADDGTTLPAMETKGPASFVAGEGATLVRLSDRLRNVETGAEVKIVAGAGVRRVQNGVLVYWPEAKPRSARLYDPVRMEERARWEQGTK